MKVVVKRPAEKPEVMEIENELHALQEIVGGHIECVGVIDNIVCVCNEEGKLKGLPPNFVLHGDMIVGDVFFCSVGEEDFASLPDEDIEFLMNIMHIFEIKI